MQVTCINNDVALIKDEAVREILKRSISLQEPDYSLEINKIYDVHYISHWHDGGCIVYLHTVPEVNYPYPYPIEYFQLCDNCIPPNWAVKVRKDRAGFDQIELGYCQWVRDDNFYEKLINDDPATIATYRELIKPKGTY